MVAAFALATGRWGNSVVPRGVRFTWRDRVWALFVSNSSSAYFAESGESVLFAAVVLVLVRFTAVLRHATVRYAWPFSWASAPVVRGW